MWFAPVLALATGLYLALLAPANLAAAAPILLLWLLSPVIAWWISLPIRLRPARLSAEQTGFLHRSARRTWDYFETFVTPQDHWLPPDNYQEHPVEVIAHRTSPTNMGIALLANLAACDFGYISSGCLIGRTAHAFDSMGKLERYRGHFYNWYDTQSLQPLAPHYVSTVDSGNLAGHLMTLQAGLRQMAEDPIVSPRLFAGLDDTLDVLALSLQGGDAEILRPFEDELRSTHDHGAGALTTASLRLERLTHSASSLAAHIERGSNAEAKRWAMALCRQCRDASDDLTHLAPWARSAPDPGGFDASVAPPADPTLRDLARLECELLPRVR
jgi:hypothetical protein